MTRRNTSELFHEELLFAHYPFRKRGTLVDVGAQRGTFLAAFASRGWPVVGFEPHPELFAELVREYRAQPNVRLVQCAIADKPGQATFYTSAEHPGIHSLAAFHDTHRPTMTVRVSTLRDELQKLEIADVSALKVDVEGADLLALQGFDFDEFRPELVMAEFMDDRSRTHFGYTHHDVARFMRSHRYETWVSEWEPLVEYGGAETGTVHRWRSLHEYDRAGSPAWGNLLFTPCGSRRRLRWAFRKAMLLTQSRELVRSVPALRAVARGLRRVAAR